jgi:hypothetical protein
MEDKKGEDRAYGQAVRLHNTKKPVAVPKEKDPYVIKAAKRTKDRLRSRFLELSES